MNDQKTNHALTGARSAVRVDLHCHSTASEVTKLGVQRALALPECATSPREVYDLAKRRGMDFVTITDHDSIAGVLELAGEPDVFVSEELTARFRHKPQAVHVLCFGITPDDHDWLQGSSGDVVACAEYLHGRDIACALAHPFFHVAAPLTAAHRRTLAELFPVWETRNGARARELNAPAAIYIETHGGIAIGGSDDHAGVDIGRTYTEAPPAATTGQLLEHIRAGRVAPHGEQGSAGKWAHAALVLGARTLGAATDSPRDEDPAPDPRATLELAERIMVEGDARDGGIGTGLGPEDGRRLLRAWLAEMELEPDCDVLLATMQAEDFSHSDLERRAGALPDLAATQRMLGEAVTRRASRA
jgi:predicted metal-dependent phosphoesterase TrpH